MAIHSPLVRGRDFAISVFSLMVRGDERVANECALLAKERACVCLCPALVDYPLSRFLQVKTSPRFKS